MEEKSDLVDFQEVVGVLGRYNKLIVGITILAIVISLIVALTSTTLYRAETILSPVTDESARAALSTSLPSQLGRIVGLSAVSGLSNTYDQVNAILNSKTFTSRFMNSEGILRYVMLTDSMGNSPDEEVNESHDFSTWDVHAAFHSIFSLEENERSGLMVLSAEWQDPDLAAEWARALVHSINEYFRDQEIQEAQRSLQYLNEQLDKTVIVGMRQILFSLIESQTRNIMLANVRDEFVLKVVDPALSPEYPVKPQKREIVVAGTFIGAVTGVLSALLCGLMDRLAIARWLRLKDYVASRTSLIGKIG